jgi:hypothetical protein
MIVLILMVSWLRFLIPDRECCRRSRAGSSSRSSPEFSVKIIAASDLTNWHKAGEASLEGVKVFLSRPYTAEKLLKALAEVLRAS